MFSLFVKCDWCGATDPAEEEDVLPLGWSRLTEESEDDEEDLVEDLCHRCAEELESLRSGKAKGSR